MVQRRRPNRARSVLVGVALAVTLAAALSIQSAAANPLTGDAASQSAGTGQPARTPSSTATRVPLAAGDELAIAVPGADGVDVLRANTGAGASGWTQIAHLSVAGWDAPQWTAYDCITGDGRYLAVTFAPVAFVDDEKLRDSGAIAAIVDVSSGASWLVPERVALTYHSPGCGLGDEVTFTRSPAQGGTDIVVAHADQDRVAPIVHTRVDLAGAVVTRRGLVAATGSQLISVSAGGGTTHLATAPGQVYDVRANDQGGVDFMARISTTTSAAFRSNSVGDVRQLATGPLQNLDVVAGRNGHNRLEGEPTGQPNGIEVVRTARLPLHTSLDGSVLVDSVPVPGLTAPGQIGDPATPRVRGRSAAVAEATTITRRITQSSPLAAATTQRPSRTTRGLRAGIATTPTVTSCAVPPLDPATQVVQTSNAQLEWAANRAVRGLLTTARPANWHKNGLPAYTPQTVIPLPALTGGGRIPVQVLLGVLAQESNFSQASFHALAGVPGDPLIGNYWGEVSDANTGLILSMDPSAADCGYGAGQITTNMRTADTTWSANVKREVATDYEVNVAATAYFLATYWNQLKVAGLIPNSGTPSFVENWYTVLWVYNSGYHPASGTSPWGLGWTNNPIQNDYDPKRKPFLDAGYQDASHPGDWPYEEKVLGWTEHPQQDFTTGGVKYTPVNGHLRLPTSYGYFCTTANDCSTASSGTGFCLSSDRTLCWWHSPVDWLAGISGTPESAAAYTAGQGEPTVTDPYPPSCTPTASPIVRTPGTAGLPSDAVIIDDLATSATNLAGCPTASSAGSFKLTYGTDASGNTTAAVDTHQIGVGYEGHAYFSHTVDKSRPFMQTTGTWTPPATVKGWQRIWVHIPNNGADTGQADYRINGPAGNQHRVVNQRWNANVWYDLGSFNLPAGSSVSLSNITLGDAALGPIDIAWDAVAFSPSTKPTVAYVALGDSYSAGEGLSPYYPDADNGGGGFHTDACHRSPLAYPVGLASDLVAKHPGNDEFHDIACSGAVTNKVSSGGLDGQENGEVGQLAQGWVDANTTFVTIGIGGNDALFAQIIAACVEGSVDCVTPTFVLPGDTKPLVQAEPTRIDALLGPLTKLYQSIKSLAPSAKIVVVGYPHVVSTTTPLRTSPVDLACDRFRISADMAPWFAQMADRLNGVIKTASASAGVTLVDPTAKFSGPPDHGACTSTFANQWINSYLLPVTTGSGSSGARGPGSFHPNTLGQSNLRTLVKPLLN